MDITWPTEALPVSGRIMIPADALIIMDPESRAPKRGKSLMPWPSIWISPFWITRTIAERYQGRSLRLGPWEDAMVARVRPSLGILPFVTVFQP